MPTILRWLKGRTSRVANQILGRSGKPIWREIGYVEYNPVKASLAETKEQWRWSGAGVAQALRPRGR
jgi:REP element-mobilizing transposase RayT